MFLRTIRKHVQSAELDVVEIQLYVDEALRFIATAPGVIVCEHAVHFIAAKIPGSEVPMYEANEIFKQSLFPQNLLKFKFDKVVSVLHCLTDQLAKYPLHFTLQDEVEEVLKFEYDRSLAQWIEALPAGGAAARTPSSRYVTLTEEVRVPLLFFEGLYLNCYGHALLDNLFALYLHLSAHGLLECPLTVIFADNNHVTEESRLATAQLLHAFAGAASQNWLARPRHPSMRPRAFRYMRARDADPVVRAVLGDMAATPYTPDQSYVSARRSPLLRAYVDRILGRLGLALVVAEPRLVTVVLRLENRRLLNPRELADFLAGRGYVVEEAVMTRMTLREQAAQARRSAVLLGPYGSNLANAVFMRAGAAVVVCAPRAARRLIGTGVLCDACARALGAESRAANPPLPPTREPPGCVAPVCAHAHT